MKIVGATGGLVGVRRVGVAYSRDKLALRTGLRNLNLKSQFSICDSFRDISVHINDFLKFVGNTATVLVCLWASEWTWHTGICI